MRVVFVSVVPSGLWTTAFSVVVVVVFTAGTGFSITVVQAEMDRTAAVAMKDRINVFIIFGWFVGSVV